MILQSWAVEFRGGKSSFLDIILEPKRVQNRSKRRSENGLEIKRFSEAIFVDFGRILEPQTPSKIVQKIENFLLFGDLGPKPAPGE